MTSFRDWAGIPEHLLDLIVTKITRLSDYFCFSFVCQQWHHAINLEVPMIMIKTEKNGDGCRGLYNVLNGITCTIQLPLHYKYKFIGSSHGWLLCLYKDLRITLLDPFNNRCKSLPSCGYPSKLLEMENMEKAILISDPRACKYKYYEAVAICRGMCKLAYYKSREGGWGFISLQGEAASDIIGYQGNIYYVTKFSKLVEVDFLSETTKIVVPASYRSEATYLVKSQNGELFLIERFQNDYMIDYETHKTFKFKVFKLVHPIDKELATWDEIDNIGEQALFVGGSCSLSVSTIKCSKLHPNSIYYTARDCSFVEGSKSSLISGSSSGSSSMSGLGSGLCIYNLGDKSIRLHHVAGSEYHVQPPIWFVPNLRNSKVSHLHRISSFCV